MRNKHVWQFAFDCLRQNTSVMLLADVESSGSQTMVLQPLVPSSSELVGETVMTLDEHRSGTVKISPTEFSFAPNSEDARDYFFTFTSDNDWLYKEHLGVLDTVLFIGSGHVGLALFRVMATLDFRVVVIDVRGTVETFTKNTFAYEKNLAAYETIGDSVRDGERSYVKVVTTAYTCDEAALKSIINKNLKYISVTGSEEKTEHICDDLRGEGIANEQLKRIRTPISLQIASHTPEEIAISIAAEIIKVKNGTS